MRIISTKTIKNCWTFYPSSEQSLKAWVAEIEDAEWENPQELKSQFGHASIITGKRVVFNINGNNFRLIVDIEYNLQIVFVVWFGTHDDYDKIDAKTIEYVKSYKK